MTTSRQDHDQLARYEVLTKVAATVGVPVPTVTLAYLADSAPEDLRGVFADRRDEFMVLANEIEAITTDNRRLATVGLDGIAGTLQLAAGVAGISPGVQSYTSEDRIRTSNHRPTRVDQALKWQASSHCTQRFQAFKPPKQASTPQPTTSQRL